MAEYVHTWSRERDTGLWGWPNDNGYEKSKSEENSRKRSLAEDGEMADRVRQEKMRKLSMEADAGVRIHWMHMSAEEWPVALQDPVAAEELRNLVRGEVASDTGEPLSSLIGSLSTEWR